MEGENSDNSFSANTFSSTSIRITVTNPQKVGNFIASFVTYRINSASNLNPRMGQNTSVTRRFNDFIILYQKLHYKYAHVGRIIPPPPEKDFSGMLSTMVTSEAEVPRMEFIEKRRKALERFLNRILSHRILREDVFFKLFLESKTNFKKTLGNLQNRNNVNISFHGLGFRDGICLSLIDDDSWFQRKPVHLQCYLEMLKGFSDALPEFLAKKKDVGDAVGHLARRIRMISNYEEDFQFSVLLNKIAEGHKDIENIFITQTQKEGALLSEVISDYVKFTLQAKTVFDIREKAFKDVQQAEKELEIRRQKAIENPSSNSEANKNRRLREQSEERLERYIQIYIEISKTIKEEITHYEQLRVNELRAAMRQWVYNSASTQEQIINIFKDYLTLDDSTSNCAPT